MDPVTGVAVEGGKPWAPMEPVTIQMLVDKANARRND